MPKSPLFLYLLWYLEDIITLLLALQYIFFWVFVWHLHGVLDSSFLFFRVYIHFKDYWCLFKNRLVNPSKMFSFLLNNISLLWDIFSTWEIIMWYTQGDSVIHYKVIQWLFLLGYALLKTSIFIQKYIIRLLNTWFEI